VAHNKSIQMNNALGL